MSKVAKFIIYLKLTLIQNSSLKLNKNGIKQIIYLVIFLIIFRNFIKNYFKYYLFQIFIYFRELLYSHP